MGPTWRPEGRHRGQEQITDAVTVHASTTPENRMAKIKEEEGTGRKVSLNNNNKKNNNILNDFFTFADSC